MLGPLKYIYIGVYAMCAITHCLFTHLHQSISYYSDTLGLGFYSADELLVRESRLDGLNCRTIEKGKNIGEGFEALVLSRCRTERPSLSTSRGYSQ